MTPLVRLFSRPITGAAQPLPCRLLLRIASWPFGPAGSFAQAGQTQQASHCRHIQMRWLVPVHWMHGWLPTSARSGPRPGVGCLRWRFLRVGVEGSAAWRSTESESSGSFESLLRAPFPVMFRLAHLLGADDPEDVAQEAFARLHRRWSELRDRPAVGGYLRTIVVNLVRSRQRHLTMARRRREVPDRTEVDSAETTALDRVTDGDILSALRALSPRHREALVLRYWLDLSERQIADAMGTSIGTAKPPCPVGCRSYEPLWRISEACDAQPRKPLWGPPERR